MKCEKLGNHTISYQSLLLSTTVLNEKDHIFITVTQNTIKCHKFHQPMNGVLKLKQLSPAVMAYQDVTESHSTTMIIFLETF